MTDFVWKSHTQDRISKDRFLSVAIWDDDTVQICIDGSGLSQIIHLTKEDVQVLIDALHGGCHA